MAITSHNETIGKLLHKYSRQGHKILTETVLVTGGGGGAIIDTGFRVHECALVTCVDSGDVIGELSGATSTATIDTDLAPMLGISVTDHPQANNVISPDDHLVDVFVIGHQRGVIQL